MISVIIQFDGKTVGCGYKYVITRGAMAWDCV